MAAAAPPADRPRDVDALRIDRMVPHDLAGDAGDQRGFAPAAALVARAKPVPALRLVGSARLFGIDHEAVLLVRQEVHPGAGGEILRRLGAAVKHDDQGKRLSLRAAWDEQLVGPASRRVAEGAFDEPCALGHDIRRGRRSAPDRTSQAEPGEFSHAVERRGAFASLSGGGLRGPPTFPSPRRRWPLRRWLVARASRARCGQCCRTSVLGRYRRGACAAGAQWPRAAGRRASGEWLRELRPDPASHHLVLSASAVLTAEVA